MKKETKKQELTRNEMLEILKSNNLVVSESVSDYVLKKQVNEFSKSFDIRLNEEELTSLNANSKIVVMREYYLTFEIVKNENEYDINVLNEFSIFAPKEKEISKRKQLEEENAQLKEMIKQLQAQVKA